MTTTADLGTTIPQHADSDPHRAADSAAIDRAREGIAQRPQLRLVVAGSVDDGKSTLVGRLLYDTKSILADQYDAIEAASRRRGSDAVDLALLTDGLRAEREQGITIDVAYRYFSTPRRSFILADTPGHTQYTRNTVTGASTADAAVLLVDARNGVLVQTRRHAAVMALLRVPHVIVAVNKMDAVGWDRSRFDAVAADARQLAERLGIRDLTVIPVSALTGQNVTDHPGEGRPEGVAGDWYDGPSLLEILEALEAPSPAGTFRMPVQLVIRPRTPEHPDYRGLAGRIASGEIAIGDCVVAHPSGVRSRISGIDSPQGPLSRAVAGQSVTLLLADELDVGRGQLLTLADEDAPGGGQQAGAAATGPSVTGQASVTVHAPVTVQELIGVVCWLDERPASPNQRVLVKVGTAVVRGLLSGAGEHWDVDDQRWVESQAPVQLNDIARVNVRLSEPVAVDDYQDNRATGGFLVVDQSSGATLAAGMVGDPLTRAFDPSI